MLNKLKNKFKIQEENILGIFKTGSSLLLDNNRDTDYIIVYKLDDNYDRYYLFTQDHDINVDYFVHSEESFNKVLNFTHELPIANISAISLVMSEPIKNSSISLDLLNKKELYLEGIRRSCEMSILNPDISWEGSDLYCHKHLWYVILGLMFIENNSYEVTPEMKEIVQKCHDGCLPKSWEDWVKERIYTDNK